jgi:hypothetical protein
MTATEKVYTDLCFDAPGSQKDTSISLGQGSRETPQQLAITLRVYHAIGSLGTDIGVNC